MVSSFSLPHRVKTFALYSGFSHEAVLALKETGQNRKEEGEEDEEEKEKTQRTMKNSSWLIKRLPGKRFSSLRAELVFPPFVTL